MLIGSSTFMIKKPRKKKTLQLDKNLKDDSQDWEQGLHWSLLFPWLQTKPLGLLWDMGGYKTSNDQKRTRKFKGPVAALTRPRHLMPSHWGRGNATSFWRCRGLWGRWPAEYNRSDAMQLLKLGHKDHGIPPWLTGALSCNEGPATRWGHHAGGATWEALWPSVPGEPSLPPHPCPGASPRCWSLPSLWFSRLTSYRH